MPTKTYVIVDLDREITLFFKKKKEADHEWDIQVGMDRSWNMIYQEINTGRKPSVTLLGMKANGYVVHAS